MFMLIFFFKMYKVGENWCYVKIYVIIEILNFYDVGCYNIIFLFMNII